MTYRLNCTTCGTPIPNGEAVRRSIRFRQVAYHPACWQGRAAIRFRWLSLDRRSA